MAFHAAFALGCDTPLTATDTATEDGGTTKLLFGADGRVEATAIGESNLERAVASTAALVSQSELACSLDSCSMVTSPMVSGPIESGGWIPLCPWAGYVGQQQGATCTAFLVGPRLMATAGHCIPDQPSCESLRVIFDFVAEPDGSSEKTQHDADDVYSCSRLVARAYQPGGADDADDWAVFELDRVAQGRFPLAIRRAGKAAVGAELIGVGHPMGLPKKVAFDGQVERNEGPRRFRHSLDLYGGNSGSPVFSASTLVVEGIHVSHAGSHFVKAVDPDTGLDCAEDRVCSFESGCDESSVGVFDAWSAAMRMAADGVGPSPATHMPLRPVEVVAVL